MAHLRRDEGGTVDEDDTRVGPDAEERCAGLVTALVHRCGRGDEAALVVLMELIYGPVRARLTVDPLPTAEGDELVRRAFVHIWNRAGSYHPTHPSGVVGWLLDEAESTLARTAPSLVAS